MITQMMILYLVGGASVALLVIVWALKSRQFQEQDRAKWLPLRDLNDGELEQPPQRKITPSVAMVFVVLAAGALVLIHLVVRLVINA